MEKKSEFSNEQRDELELLTSMYMDEFKEIEDSKEKINNLKTFEIELFLKNGFDLQLKFSLPQEYPKKSMPLFQIVASWMTEQDQKKIESKFQELFKKKDCCLVEWINYIMTDAEDDLKLSNRKPPVKKNEKEEDDTSSSEEKEESKSEKRNSYKEDDDEKKKNQKKRNKKRKRKVEEFKKCFLE